MIEGRDDEAVMYVNFKTDFNGFRIVKDVDLLLYISDTDIEEGH
jgi:hypothetical protein